MYKIPKWWVKFKRNITVQDIITGRKIVQRTTDDEGKEHISIEVAAADAKTA